MPWQEVASFDPGATGQRKMCKIRPNFQNLCNKLYLDHQGHSVPSFPTVPPSCRAKVECCTVSAAQHALTIRCTRHGTGTPEAQPSRCAAAPPDTFHRYPDVMLAHGLLQLSGFDGLQRTSASFHTLHHSIGLHSSSTPHTSTHNSTHNSPHSSRAAAQQHSSTAAQQHSSTAAQ
jgi:hypothetical protein